MQTITSEPDFEAELATWLKAQHPHYRRVGVGIKSGIKTKVLSLVEPCECCGTPIVVLSGDGKPPRWYSLKRVLFDVTVNRRGWHASWVAHTPIRCQAARAAR